MKFKVINFVIYGLALPGIFSAFIGTELAPLIGRELAFFFVVVCCAAWGIWVGRYTDLFLQDKAR